MGRLLSPSRADYDAETLRLYGKCVRGRLYVTDGRRRRRVHHRVVLAYPVIEAYFYSGLLPFTGKVSANATGWHALKLLMDDIGLEGRWRECD